MVTKQAQAEPTPTPGSPQPDAHAHAANWRWDILWLSAIIVVAFVLRLVYVWQLQTSPYFATHVMDPLYHHEWARAFAAGETFWEGAYFRAPLYPWFLGVIYWLFGADNAFAPRIVQAVLGALSCGLLYLIGRQVFSRTVGVIAGFAAGTYWIFLYFDAELLIPVLIVFLDLVLLWLLLWTQDRRRPLLWIACGVVLGASAIARPNILLFAPPLVAWLLVLHWPRWRRALAYAACLFSGCVAPILPITIRNYVVGDDFVLIASQGGVNFYIGNNPHSDGMSAIVKGDPAEWQPCYEAQIARAQTALGHVPKPSEVSRWYTRQAWRFMWQQPRQAGLLLLKKLGYFWSRWEVPNNQDIRFITSHYTPVVRYLPLRFWIVGPLGALGLLLTFRRAKTLFPLWGFVLVYMFTVVAFFVTARYRVPAVAVLILLGSQAVCWGARALHTRRWPRLALAVPVLAVMGFVVARTPPKVDKLMIQEHRETGLTLASLGRLTEAEQILNEFVKRASASGAKIDAEAWYHLGYVRLKRGNATGAVECFEHALQARAYYPEARKGLAYALITLGQPDEAMQHFEQVVQDDPQDDAAHAELGKGLAQLGRIDQAIEHLLRAIELNHANIRTLVETADILRRQGNPAGAERLEKAARQRFADLMRRATSPR